VSLLLAGGTAPPPTIPAGEQLLPPITWRYGPTIVYDQQNQLGTSLAKKIVIRDVLTGHIVKLKHPNLSFEFHNLLLTTLTVAPSKPVGIQLFDSILPKIKNVVLFEPQNLLNTLLVQVAVFPVGKQIFDDVLPKSKTSTYFEYQNLLSTLLAVQQLPVGIQLFIDNFPKDLTSVSFDFQNNLIVLTSSVGEFFYYDITTGRLFLDSSSFIIPLTSELNLDLERNSIAITVKNIPPLKVIMKI